MSKAQLELATITSTMSDLSTRLTALVENEGGGLSTEVYRELVGAERTIGALVRRLNRLANRLL